MFLVGLAVNITFALLMAFFRATYVDFWGVVLCVAMMSISTLFYIIGGQYLVSKVLHLVPISGYAGGLDTAKFVILPVLIGVVSGIGSGSRWYRTISRRWATTCARHAQGTCRVGGPLPARAEERDDPDPHPVGGGHPLLFMGSLLSESFFGIPGLGSYTIDAIQAQDFAVVRSMVFIGSVLYIVGLLLTDLSYTLVDPRIRLE